MTAQKGSAMLRITQPPATTAGAAENLVATVGRYPVRWPGAEDGAGLNLASGRCGEPLGFEHVVG
jgi:hypothetical protein